MDYLKDKHGEKITKIKNKNGEIIHNFGSGIRNPVVNPYVAKLVKEYLISVTKKGGTAEKAAINGYQVAGKTGTSQIYDKQLGRYSNTRYISSFVGFAPASEPLVTVLVIVDQPRTSYYGGIVAAPIFKDFVKRTLLFEDVLPFPDDETEIKFQKETVNR